MKQLVVVQGRLSEEEDVEKIMKLNTNKSENCFFFSNSFVAAGDYSRQRALSAGVDRSRRMLHTSEISDIFHSNGLWETTHCGILSKNYSTAKIACELC